MLAIHVSNAAVYGTVTPLKVSKGMQTHDTSHLIGRWQDYCLNIGNLSPLALSEKLAAHESRGKHARTHDTSHLIGRGRIIVSISGT